MEYGHGGDIYTYRDMLDFSVNVNPLGPSGKVIEAAKKGVERSAQYPDSRCRELRTALSEKKDRALSVSNLNLLFALWMIRMLNFKFGTLPGRRDLSLSLRPILEMPLALF